MVSNEQYSNEQHFESPDLVGAHFFSMFIRPNEYGRGVYTSEFIQAGSLISVEPMKLFKGDELEQIESTDLERYFFRVSYDPPMRALVFGFGMLLNHSPQPTLSRELLLDQQIAIFRARRNIHPDEELTCFYKGSREAILRVHGFDIGDQAPPPDDVWLTS